MKETYRCKDIILAGVVVFHPYFSFFEMLNNALRKIDNEYCVTCFVNLLQKYEVVLSKNER